MTSSPSDKLFVASVEKAFQVLEAFRKAQSQLKLRDLGLNQIAQFSGLNKSAAQRFTSTLVTLGYLEQNPHSRRFRPAIRLLELSYTYLISDRLAQLAMPILIDLSRTRKVTSNLCVLQGADIIFTVRIPQDKASFGTTIVGRKVPAFCTASGNAILSRMPEGVMEQVLGRSNLVKFTEFTVTDIDTLATRIREARKLGFSIIANETQLNMINVAAPILNTDGVAVASVQVPVSLSGWSPERVRAELVPYVVEAANKISQELSELH